MSGQPLEVKVRVEGEVAVIDLTGDIDAAGDHALSGAYAEAASGRDGPILFNFSGVHFINSTGIALIVGLLAQARKTGHRLLVCGLSQHYLEIFRLTRLSDFMTIYPDEASATRAGTGSG